MSKDKDVELEHGEFYWLKETVPPCARVIGEFIKFTPLTDGFYITGSSLIQTNWRKYYTVIKRVERP